MAKELDLVSEPIPISLISGRYLLFDINVVTYLRRTHHICGVLIGGIPQVPQQNVFLGLPLELIPEEARLLVEKEVAYIVDDTAWHRERFSTLKGEDRQKYLASLRAEGLKAKQVAQNEVQKRSENYLAKRALETAGKNASAKSSREDEPLTLPESVNTNTSVNDTDSLFSDRHSTPDLSKSTGDSVPYGITRATTYPTSMLPENPTQQSDPTVPPSYPLFSYLHSRGYYLMPGLRFGCHYNVYPGDPLRFHSHFLATGYEWDEDIAMLDLIGGGRLGTAVKKGFLIGGGETELDSERNNVRTFTIEWAAM